MRVAVLFIDGVGVGRPDPAINPLARAPFLLSQFEDGSGEALPAGGHLHRVDTTFDVPGRPQSATNQTAILTGLPAPKLVGRHVLGFPTPDLRTLLEEHSIVRRLLARGRSATFANAYPAAYLDLLKLRRRESAAAPPLHIPERAARRLKASASTLAMAAGQVALRTLEDAHAGEGLTHDIDGESGTRRGFAVPRRSPEEAARLFWRLARPVDFTLFEHYLADEAGHAQDAEKALAALSTFDRFARAVVATRPDDAWVLICSDHGNVEDLSIRSHTRHPVAVLTFGPPQAAAPRLHTVADVGRTVLDWLGALD